MNVFFFYLTFCLLIQLSLKMYAINLITIYLMLAIIHCLITSIIPIENLIKSYFNEEILFPFFAHLI